MKPWVKKVLLGGIVLIILGLYFPVVNLLTFKSNYDETKYNILLAERDSLKKDLESLTNLAYDAYDYVYGKVVLREMYNFTEELVIKTDQDIVDNMIVVNNEGVVGITYQAKNKKALVKLLTNKDTSLSIKINDLYGKLSYKDKLIVEDIAKDKIKVGDKVYTSGLTKYPGGLLIGTVSKITKYIEVESPALTNISSVLVLKGEA